MISLDEYRKRKEETSLPDVDMRTLERLEQTAVKAKQLTGNPGWDMYLTYLQTAVDGYKKEKTSAVEKLISPAIVNQDEIMAAKSIVQTCSATIAALEAAMSLPVDLIKIGEKAKSISSRINRKEDTDGKRIKRKK